MSQFDPGGTRPTGVSQAPHTRETGPKALHHDSGSGLGPGARRLPLAHWGFSTGPRGLELGCHHIAGLVETHGTPFYLFDEGRLRSNIREALAATSSFLPEADLRYSFKTNAVPRVLDIVCEEGLGAEVISGRELREALSGRFAPDRIVFNGPGKRDEDLTAAVDAGVLVQVESASEARALVRAARSRGRPVRAGIRINPDIYDDRAQRTIRMGSRGSVFGLDPAGDEFADAVRTLAGAAEVRLESLSASIGTGIVSTEPFRQVARTLVSLREQLRKQGVAITVLDGGGGYTVRSEVRYAEGAFDNHATDAAAVPAPETIATFAEVCGAIAGELVHARDIRYILEPGRLLVSDAFHLIARVIRLKEEGGIRFAILDAGRAQNALFVARGYHEIVHVGAPDAAAHATYTIVGPLCASFDTFARERPMPLLAEGDLVALLDVGAYNLSAQSRWSFDPASIVAIRGDIAVPLPSPV